jgi:hypothetical protein
MEAFPAHRGHRKGQRKIGLTQTAARRIFRHRVQYAPVFSEWIGLSPLTTAKSPTPAQRPQNPLVCAGISVRNATYD